MRLVLTFGKERIIHERLQLRLDELKIEFEKGRTRLQALEKEQMHLRETMLRISGAVQILEEVLSDEHTGIHLSETQAGASQAHPVKGMESAFQRLTLEEHDHRQSQDGVAVNTLGEKE
jgi:predicted nuclease with TOPRIM domain